MAFETLNPIEAVEAKQWYNKLDNPNKRNVGNVISIFKMWTNSEEPINPSSDKYGHQFDASYHGLIPYFVLYAVGSTITEKENPTDIDMLAITNVYLSMKNEYLKPDINALIRGLTVERTVSVDDKVTERYDWETDCRIKIDIGHKDKEVKDIDLIYQWNVMSRDRWEHNDKYESLPLFQIGQPIQVHRASEYTGMGWRSHDIPMETWRLKDENNQIDFERKF